METINLLLLHETETVNGLEERIQNDGTLVLKLLELQSHLHKQVCDFYRVFLTVLFASKQVYLVLAGLLDQKNRVSLTLSQLEHFFSIDWPLRARSDCEQQSCEDQEPGEAVKHQIQSPEILIDED